MGRVGDGRAAFERGVWRRPIVDDVCVCVWGGGCGVLRECELTEVCWLMMCIVMQVTVAAGMCGDVALAPPGNVTYIALLAVAPSLIAVHAKFSSGPCALCVCVCVSSGSGIARFNSSRV